MNDSLTSTWISSESMSTMVPMPVRVKPPPAEIGEIISPGLGRLGDDHAAERRADHGVVELHLGHRDRLLGHLDLLAGGDEPGPEHVALGARGVEGLRGGHLGHGDRFLGDPDLLLAGREPGPQGVALGPRGVERLRRDELPLEELPLPLVLPLGLLELGLDLGHLRPGGGQLRPRRRELRLAREEVPLPLVVPLGLLELGLDLGHLRAGGGELRPREGELRLGLRVVEPGQHGAFLDPHALLDQHLGDLAGDLGRHGGLSPRGHVAAGVQHGAPVRARAGRPRRGRAHGGRGGPRQGEPEQAAGERQQRHAGQDEPARAGARRARVLVDAQLLEQVRRVHGFEGSAHREGLSQCATGPMAGPATAPGQGDPRGFPQRGSRGSGCVGAPALALRPPEEREPGRATRATPGART